MSICVQKPSIYQEGFPARRRLSTHPFVKHQSLPLWEAEQQQYIPPVPLVYPKVALVKGLGRSNRERDEERFRNCPQGVSFSTVRAPFLARVDSKSKMDSGQAHNDESPKHFSHVHSLPGFSAFCFLYPWHDPQGVSDVSKCLFCNYFNKRLYNTYNEPDTLSVLKTFINLIPVRITLDSITILILQMKKIRHRDVKYLDQGTHRNKWQSQDLNEGS